MGIFNNVHDRTITEDTAMSSDDTITGGYVQSKWVGERIVILARERGINANIIRLGRVGGDRRTGIYNKNDTIMRLLETCVDLGVAPKINLMLDLLPIDFVAEAITYISTQTDIQNKQFHLLQKNVVSIKKIIESIIKNCEHIKFVSTKCWIGTVRKSDQFKLTSVSPIIDDIECLLFSDIKKLNTNYRKTDISNTLNVLCNFGLTFPIIDNNILDIYARAVIENFTHKSQSYTKEQCLPTICKSEMHLESNSYNTLV